MMKKMVTLLLTLCMILCISACGENKKTKDEKETGVSMRQIEDDISKLSVVQNGVVESKYTPQTSYTVDDIEIEKRQTNIDDKEDIVYCNVRMSNEYYRSNFQIEMNYNYYDEGGWILDSKRIISKESFPLRGVDLSTCIIVYYENDVDNIEPTVENCVPTQSTNLKDNIDIIYITDNENNYTVYSKIVFSFDQDMGWYTENCNKEYELIPKIYDAKFDYANVMNGTYYHHISNDPNFSIVCEQDYLFKITSYNDATGEIQGSFNYYAAFDKSYIKNESFSTILDKKDCTITFPAIHLQTHRVDDTTVTLSYDFDKDIWKVHKGWNEIELTRQ